MPVGTDWRGIAGELDSIGFAPLPPLLSPSDCDSLAATYGDDSRFRSRIDMERFRFGSGEYKYFAWPLPAIVQSLREELYAGLAPIANGWMPRLKVRREYPPTLGEYLDRCHRAGQRRPTPLLLRYEAGGYNCLHQDLYGDHAFPFQAVFVLSRPGVDFTGGEFLLVEQRPRAQSRGHAIRIEHGGGLVFAVRERPVAGTRGDYRTVMRHGVSTVLTGRRMSLGIIFHDAK